MAGPSSHTPESASGPPSPAGGLELRLSPADDPHGQVQEGLRKLAAARRQLEEDRRDWELDAERQAESLALRSRQLLEREQGLAAARSAVDRRESSLQKDRQELERRDAELRGREQNQARKEAELAAARQHLHDLREQLQSHYAKRRDSLTSLQESVQRAARKVQDQKREQQADDARLRVLVEKLEQRQAGLQARAEQIEREGEAHSQQHRLVEEWQRDLEEERLQNQAHFQSEDRRLAEERRQLEAGQEQHRGDLARLERFQAALAEREAALAARARDLDERAAQLGGQADELHQQARALEDRDARLRSERQELAQRGEEAERRERELAERLAACETQQGLLTGLRTRTEKLRAELLEREQGLTGQRLRQDDAERALRDEARQLQEQRLLLARDRAGWLEERDKIQERCAGLESALERLKQVQSAFEETERQHQERRAALEEAARATVQSAELVRIRAERMHASRARLLAARQALRERESRLLATDETRETLQDQLRRRSSELAARERELAERSRAAQDAWADLEARRTEIEHARKALDENLARRQQELDRLEQSLAEREQAIEARAQEARTAQADLQSAAEQLEAERRRLASAREEVAGERERLQGDAAALGERLPELVRQAQSVLARVGKAREQLRGHLAEVHGYAQQAQAELEASQRDVAVQGDLLRDQHHQLTRAQSEHRLAVSAFRQQLADWQEQFAELKVALAHDESNLDRRQAQLEEQARHIDETTTRLAERAQTLQSQEREVSRKRDEINRHLLDLQRWYRHKLRELAERRLLNPAAAADRPAEAIAGHVEADDSPPAILSLQGELAPDDRPLVERLTNMALIDGRTLSALLVEARKRNGSLRDALLDGDYLSPFQLELIETGNLEALVLGPLRIVDRLRLTPLETVYRVFDPRRGEEALLRQLGAAVAEDRKAEFRGRFEKACGVRHAHVASTLEVLDMDGSPAALQEWIVGVPSSEWAVPWAAQAGSPAVWLRLLHQAAQGLHAAHQAALVHGHLHAGRILLTEHGELKLCGLGEPAWLFPDLDSALSRSAGHQADLNALGGIAQKWLQAIPAARLGKRGAEPLQVILRRLQSAEPAQQYPSAAELLQHLDRVRADAPEDLLSWRRLLDFVRERLAPVEDELPARRSA